MILRDNYLLARRSSLAGLLPSHGLLAILGLLSLTMTRIGLVIAVWRSIIQLFSNV